MDKKTVQFEILKLLKDSTISDHDKEMVQILLPVMERNVLANIHTALKNERRKMKQLDQKQKRVEMKYRVMVDKLCKMQLKKKY
ncbi:MAG: hypothetical protein GWP15_02665 [Nitrospirae bacterium]|nr:hypothetical protein [Nitrospirota bacterium]